MTDLGRHDITALAFGLFIRRSSRKLRLVIIPIIFPWIRRLKRLQRCNEKTATTLINSLGYNYLNFETECGKKVMGLMKCETTRNIVLTIVMPLD